VAAGAAGYFPCPKVTTAGCQLTFNVGATDAGPSADQGTGMLEVLEVAAGTSKSLLSQLISTNGSHRSRLPSLSTRRSKALSSSG